MKSAQAVRALGALAQDTRLAIYRMLVQQGPEGLAAGAIAARLDESGVRELLEMKGKRGRGQIEPRQQGRFVYYSTNYKQMNGLLDFLSENCCQGACAAPPAPARKLKRSTRFDSRRRP